MGFTRPTNLPPPPNFLHKQLILNNHCIQGNIKYIYYLFIIPTRPKFKGHKRHVTYRCICSDDAVIRLECFSATEVANFDFKKLELTRHPFQTEGLILTLFFIIAYIENEEKKCHAIKILPPSPFIFYLIFFLFFFHLQDDKQVAYFIWPNTMQLPTLQGLVLHQHASSNLGIQRIVERG